MKIGDFVIFTSYRYTFGGRALGKIIRINKHEIFIKRIDNDCDPVNYHRIIQEDLIDNPEVFVLDTQDEFLARLEF